eukprot:1285730-Rhodomonas_salina.1
MFFLTLLSSLPPSLPPSLPLPLSLPLAPSPSPSLPSPSLPPSLSLSLPLSHSLPLPLPPSLQRSGTKDGYEEYWERVVLEMKGERVTEKADSWYTLDPRP